MKSGVSGRIAGFFLDSKLTPLLIVASLAAGLAGLVSTPREEEPQIRVPMIDIAVGFPGGSPSEVERRIVEPLERAVWEIPDVDYVYSIASIDGAMVTARFKVGTDPDIAASRIWSKLMSRADKMPSGATQPLIVPHGINEVPIMTLTLFDESGTFDRLLLRQQAVELMNHIKRIPDVAETWVIGGAPREVSVRLNPAELQQRGLSAPAVVEALQGANRELPSGSFASSDRVVEVRAGSLLRDASQVASVVVGVFQGAPVLLHEVASIEDGPAPPTEYVEHVRSAADGGDVYHAVTIALAKREGTNAATIAHEVERRVEELTDAVVASGLEVVITRDYGETATEKSRELLLHILIATFGVVALVWLALGYREAAVVLVAVPVTLALTLLVYRLYGYTLNRITLFALVFAIGILVDDAIVVIENIARHARLKASDVKLAAILAVDEVGNPTILATLTVIAAILPMAFVSGLMGPYMRPIPVGASVAMIFSLGVAFIVTPWMAVRLIGNRESRHDADVHDHSHGPVMRLYESTLTRLVNSRRMRFATYGAMVLLLALAVLLLPTRLVTVKMLPFDDKSEFQLIVDMPEGTSLERTAAVARQLARAVAADPDVAHVQTYAGTAAPFNFNGLVRHYFLRRGPAVADVQVNLLPKHDRNLQSHDIALRVRPVIDSIARSTGASVKLAEIPPGPPVLATLTAEVYGPAYEDQVELAREVRRIFDETPGVVDVDWSVEERAPQLMAIADQQRLAFTSLSVSDLARTVAAGFGGYEATHLRDETAAEPVPVRVYMEDSLRSSASLDQLAVSTPRGGAMVSSFAELETVSRPISIHHKNLKPVVYVTADVAGTYESPVYAMLELSERLKDLDEVELHWAGSPGLTEEPSVAWDGEWWITYEVFRDLGIAFAAVLILIYFLVVAWFQSFVTPLVIMAPIPLTLVGILPAHAVTGAFFTATSMIGMIALAGIIVRNSILLVDFIELRREAGDSVEHAVIQSGVIRARPILLTAAAVVIGGLVMVSDPIFEGLGVALMAGAVVATLLTLVLVPLLYQEVGSER